MRLLHEQHVKNYDSMFITLTYSDTYIPNTQSICKKELRNFFKRLRKRIKKKIKYFACGEYGEKCPEHLIKKCPDCGPKVNYKFRPHYHAIILGLGFWIKEDRKAIVESWKLCDWTPKRTQMSFGSVSPDSIRYVADYIHKKNYSNSEQGILDHYGYREPEFQIQSQGMGLDWAIKEKDNIMDSGKINYKGKEVSLPRYYTKKIEVSDKIKMENKQEFVNELRKKYKIKPLEMEDMFNGRLLDDKYQQELYQGEKNLVAQARMLKSKKL